MKHIFIDTETTGTDPEKHGLIQIAGDIFIDGKHVERFDYRACPFGRDVIDEQALEVNGLTLDEISAFSPPKNTYLNFSDLLSKHCDKYRSSDKYHFIGYNADFDAKFADSSKRTATNISDHSFGGRSLTSASSPVID